MRLVQILALLKNLVVRWLFVALNSIAQYVTVLRDGQATHRLSALNVSSIAGISATLFAWEILGFLFRF